MAAADNEAAAKLTLLAIDKVGVKSIEDFSGKLKTALGRLYAGGYSPSLTKSEYQRKPVEKIVGDTSKYNAESVFMESLWCLQVN
ncbi:hypothetical protein [Echinicola rosea]|uniref:Uncharacterized protein n=1 Tax=Echinicola rosea TaxID=1807691 RepID=A0ABQ1VCF1_9BACT|nr:hypothetical protein [Echinicola rosea]GGF49884.1 hypothetical protein GCM10011339_43060 [Echinicola rosea]